MNRHIIKITSGHYQDKLNGIKDWELREDRGYKVGDEVQYKLFKELFHWETQPEIYKITNTLREWKGLEKGYVIFSDKLITKNK